MLSLLRECKAVCGKVQERPEEMPAVVSRQQADRQDRRIQEAEKRGERMTAEEAIENLKYLISEDCTESHFDYTNEIEMAIEALKKVQDYEAQWIDDIDNPLEPLKLSAALNAEIFVLKERLKNKPKEISTLDYTVIAALQDCLKRYAKRGEEE